MLPANGPAVQAPPSVPAHVVEQVSAAGNVSVTRAAGFAPGPLFDAVIV